MATLYYESDADPTLIQGRKVAILGYGSQGHAHALNLAESGVDVRVALRAGSSTRPRRRRPGCGWSASSEAAAEADVIMILLPDTEQKDVYDTQVAPHLQPGDCLMFAHGFNIRFGQIVAARRRRRGHGGPEGSRATSSGAPTPRGAACPASSPWPRTRPGKAHDAGPVLRPRPRRHPGRRARHDLRGGDRDRSLRRAGGPVRRADRARPRRLRDPGRGRVPARVRLLRVPARAEADRRPHVRAGHRRHALLDVGHRRVRRPDPGAHGHRRTRPRQDAGRSWPTSGTAPSPRSGSPRTGRAGPASASCARPVRSTRSRRSAPSCGR